MIKSKKIALKNLINKKRKTHKKRNGIKKKISQHGGVEKLMCERVLGEGAYGIVFMGESKISAPVAVKFLKGMAGQGGTYDRQIKIHRNEKAIYEIIKDLNCENLLKSIEIPDINISIVGAYNLNKSEPALITELCEFDLNSLINGFVQIGNMNIYGTNHTVHNIQNKTILYYIASQIFNGLYALYQKNIVHCDIKPENVLVKRENGDKYTFKICDFGFATKHDQFPIANTYNKRYSENKEKLYQRHTLGYSIFSNLHIFNTYMKDLTGYALTLYVLEHRKICDIKTENLSISKVTGSVKIVKDILYFISVLEQEMLLQAPLHNNHAKDTEIYKKTYEEIKGLFEKWVESIRVPDSHSIPITNKKQYSLPLTYNSTNSLPLNESFIIPNMKVKNIKNIETHYSRSMGDLDSYITTGSANASWDTYFQEMCEDRP